MRQSRQAKSNNGKVGFMIQATLCATAVELLPNGLILEFCFLHSYTS